MATVTFFHAHADDEAIATAGTMAALSDQGHRVVLMTATGGELGEIPDGLLAEGETLTERRRAELDEACRILGVHRQVYLGYRDSGMAGEATNGDPRSFAAADPGGGAELVADLLREEETDVFVIYDEHGGYGHPDHIQVHEVGRRAADLAGTPVLYLWTVDRDRLLSMAERSEWAPPEEERRDMETMGEPGWRITTEVDVRPWIDRKRDAMRAHRSQITADSFFLSMPDDIFAEVWGTESYIRVRPAYPDTDGRRETELVLEADPGLPARTPSAAEERR